MIREIKSTQLQVANMQGVVDSIAGQGIANNKLLATVITRLDSIDARLDSIQGVGKTGNKK